MTPGAGLLPGGRSQSALIIAVLTGCTVLASRLWLIRHYGSGLPYFDQWDGEGLAIYAPYLEGRLSWSQLLQPHNEHRILLTHLQNLGLLAVTGAWLPVAQMTINAAWFGFLASLIAHRQYTGLPPGSREFAVVFVTLIFVCPFGWQNALWGFQSQHYFGMLLAAVAAFRLLDPHRPTLTTWGSGAAAAGLALLASGSGVVTCAALTLCLGLSGVLRLVRWRALVAPLLVMGVLTLAGLMLLNDVPAHDRLKSGTWGQFFDVLLRCLAWPNINRGAVAFVAWLPMGLLLYRAVKVRVALSQASVMALSFGLIACTHAASVAYARGGGLVDGTPISRYQEFLSWGVLANATALMILWQDNATTWLRRIVRPLALVWGLSFAIGLAELTAINFRLHLPFKAMTDARQSSLLTAYMEHHDSGLLRNRPYYEIGHTSAEAIMAVLDHESLQTILPSPLSRPGARARAVEERLTRFVPFGGPLFVAFGLALTVCLYRSFKSSQRTVPKAA